MPFAIIRTISCQNCESVASAALNVTVCRLWQCRTSQDTLPLPRLPQIHSSAGAAAVLALGQCLCKCYSLMCEWACNINSIWTSASTSLDIGHITLCRTLSSIHSDIHHKEHLFVDRCSEVDNMLQTAICPQLKQVWCIERSIADHRKHHLHLFVVSLGPLYPSSDHQV